MCSTIKEEKVESESEFEDESYEESVDEQWCNYVQSDDDDDGEGTHDDGNRAEQMTEMLHF